MAQLGTISSWHKTAPDRRIVNVLVGQKFGNANVPFGVTGIFAAPTGNGACDGYSLQVIPSPLSCADLQKSILAHGKPLANLAGLPLLLDAGGSQVTLMPTAGNGCVIVGQRAAYTP